VGDTRRAIEKLKAVTDKNPSERTLALLARSYRELRDYKSAAEALERAVALAPDDTRLTAELAEDLFLCNRLDDALHLYQQLAADDPQNPMLPLRISEIYRVKRDFAKALRVARQSQIARSGGLDVRIDEINLLETEGKSNEAIALLKGLLDETRAKTYSAADAANRSHPARPAGRFLPRAGQYPQAIEAFPADRPPGSAKRAARRRADRRDLSGRRKTWKRAKEADAALKKYPGERMVQLTHASVVADQARSTRPPPRFAA